VTFTFAEWCYISPQDANGFQRGKAVPTGLSQAGYCSVETDVLKFTLNNHTLKSIDSLEDITYPEEAKGSVRQVFSMTPCNGSTSFDVHFSLPYCSDPCPILLEINDQPCNAQCKKCSNTSAAVDCSNIDTTLVEQCGAATSEDDLFGAIIRYFESTTDIPKSVSQPTQPSPSQPTSPSNNNHNNNNNDNTNNDNYINDYINDDSNNNNDNNYNDKGNSDYNDNAGRPMVGTTEVVSARGSAAWRIGGTTQSGWIVAFMALAMFVL